MRQNGTTAVAAEKRWQSAESLDPANWVDLGSLAVWGFGRPPFGEDSLETRVDNLRRELADEIIVDDLGRDCVARSVARVMFTERPGPGRI
jgi:hypothetical protein